MLYALRLFRYREARLKVETPTAIVGVRGTQFCVHVFWMEGKEAVDRGVRVAQRGRESLAAYLAESRGGRRSGTVVGCGDGPLNVTDPATGRQGAQVNPGEVFNTHTGEKAFDPQNRTLNGIASETQELKDGKGQGEIVKKEISESSKKETAVVGHGADGSTGAGTPTEANDLTTDVTHRQTGEETTGHASGQNNHPNR